ncbi:Epoxyqueuosine reductase [Alishewanella longhuensis]
MLALFQWDEATFLKYTEGSAIRRIGHERWRRNLAVALGNAPYQAEISQVLTAALTEATPLLAEHIDWALQQQKQKGWQHAKLLPPHNGTAGTDYSEGSSQRRIKSCCCRIARRCCANVYYLLLAQRAGLVPLGDLR